MAEEIVGAILTNAGRYHTDNLKSCYEEFLRLKPDVNVLGDIFYILLTDATLSLIKTIARSCDSAIMQSTCNGVIELTVKYARIYFAMNREERVLLMLRSTLYDLVRDYDTEDKKFDQLATNLYESIRRLITV